MSGFLETDFASCVRRIEKFWHGCSWPVKTGYLSIVFCMAAAVIFITPLAAHAQSTDQNFPTAVAGPEIRGVIKARDIGDSRLTSYFYELTGEQGDVFINVVTKNFNGDIDFFSMDGLKPLTKIVIYASGGQDETGRIIYLRKPERMLLRIEGRTPGDDPATFTIKFAGSFTAMKTSNADKKETLDTLDSTKSDPEGVRLSSVGAVIASSTVKENTRKKPADSDRSQVWPKDPSSKATGAEPKTVEPKDTGSKIAVEVHTPPPEKTPDNLPQRPVPAEKVEKETGIEVETKSEPSNKTENDRTKAAKGKRSTPPEPKVDPLASAVLVVTMRDGTLFERPMKDVVRFFAEKGRLTIVSKGETIRYSLADVLNIAIR